MRQHIDCLEFYSARSISPRLGLIDAEERHGYEKPPPLEAGVAPMVASSGAPLDLQVRATYRRGRACPRPTTVGPQPRTLPSTTTTTKRPTPLYATVTLQLSRPPLPSPARTSSSGARRARHPRLPFLLPQLTPSQPPPLCNLAQVALPTSSSSSSASRPGQPTGRHGTSPAPAHLAPHPRHSGPTADSSAASPSGRRQRHLRRRQPHRRPPALEDAA